MLCTAPSTLSHGLWHQFQPHADAHYSKHSQGMPLVIGYIR